MRRTVAVIVLILSFPTITPASALQLSDTMNAWGQASGKERTELLRQLFGGAEKPGVRQCMDDTSRTPGHTELAIGEVAKVCAQAGKTAQPV